MKTLFGSVLLSGCLLISGYSQGIDHSGSGRFVKRVEYNLTLGDYFNLDSKGDKERLFFGDFNAPFEFFLEPSFTPSIGLRLVKDVAQGAYVLEVKQITNFPEVRKQVEAKYPPIGVPFAEYSSITPEIHDQMAAHNRSMWAKQREEALKLYRVDSRALPVSNQFAEKLHKRMGVFIDNFKAKEVPGLTGEGRMVVGAILDGDCITFRTVVDDEVWSLRIYEPTGNARKWSDYCQQVITDILANSFDEAKYLKLLDE